MVDAFRGYNHTLRIGDGEFYDMENLTSDYYPVMSPRKKRGVYARPASPQGLIAKEMLCYVDGTDFVIGRTRYDMGLSTQAEDCPKRLTGIGAYVIILPDKKYINTISPEDRGQIEHSFQSVGEVTVTLCTAQGEAYQNITVSASAPETAEAGQLWMDTSGEKHLLKRYAQDQWVTVAATYVRIGNPGIGAGFSKYDGVTISGLEAEGLNGSFVVQEISEDYLVVTGLIDNSSTQTEPVTVSRKMPELDYITESGNRLWGCRYGDGLNEIYACKLGDFKNWECFMGLATDSYRASLGTDGPFTGAVTHMGYPLFFKEGFLHKIYGTQPSNFQIQSTALRGVEMGSHGSLAIAGETLYYKSRSGICAYDGSLPVDIGAPLGGIGYRNAVGGSHGSKYYISMEDCGGKWNLFVYDSAKGMWHREDSFQASFLCSYLGELYGVDAENRNIITLLGSGEAGEETVRWMAESGDLGLSSPDRKYLAGLTVRMLLEPGSYADFYAQYDLTGEWVHLAKIFGTNLRSFSVPLRPRRADHMKLRIEGAGMGKIYSITKTIEEGSDLP